jgi:hypothetical protein
MGTYLDIAGDPNEVSGAAAVLRSMAESFHARAQAIASEIEAVHAERPWGSDSYGQAFQATYNAPAEGGGEPMSEVMQDAMSHAGERLSHIADQTVLAMTEYQAIDAEAASAINQANV